ncbi:hypothetical protein [Catellatospora tritici]|uniref:hypothetical protein n=1 Tax=Catellatospora tritici TaxID=2851566 RepID=UPI001C2CCB41|nr:hypothetical protein [Catellatospora tritici]MBV1850706.1 hypothetical protein [Catellatospora tritici]MBV1850959.1 hypothetical protein [Catellatospora tritici]
MNPSPPRQLPRRAFLGMPVLVAAAVTVAPQAANAATAAAAKPRVVECAADLMTES